MKHLTDESYYVHSNIWRRIQILRDVLYRHDTTKIENVSQSSWSLINKSNTLESLVERLATYFQKQRDKLIIKKRYANEWEGLFMVEIQSATTIILKDCIGQINKSLFSVWRWIISIFVMWLSDAIRFYRTWYFNQNWLLKISEGTAPKILCTSQKELLQNKKLSSNFLSCGCYFK